MYSIELLIDFIKCFARLFVQELNLQRDLNL